MTTVLGVPLILLLGQVLLGIIQGSLYATLSLGLAVIFGMLRVINFAHGAQYMLGGVFSWALLYYFNIGFWWALLLSPLLTAIVGVAIEKILISRTYAVDHLNAFLLTLGVALVLEGVVRYVIGNAVRSFPPPRELLGVINLGFMVVPIYRAFVVGFSLSLCLAIWLAIERTKLGAFLRASTEDPTLVGLFGINVPRLMTATYAAGAGLAAVGGVLAAPIFQVSPLMGHDLIIVVFAIVVIGGAGSIIGTVVTALALGILEGLTKVFYPEAAGVVVYVVMAIVLLVRPSGLFGRP